jgi:hypothetical protein
MSVFIPPYQHPNIDLKVDKTSLVFAGFNNKNLKNKKKETNKKENKKLVQTSATSYETTNPA